MISAQPLPYLIDLTIITEPVVFGPAICEADRIPVGCHAGDVGVAAARADTTAQASANRNHENMRYYCTIGDHDLI